MTDATAELELWRRVVDEARDLVATVEESLAGSLESDGERAKARRLTVDVAQIAAWRKRWTADDVRVAVELAQARARAVGRITPRPGSPAATTGLIADRAGVEQATSTVVARHKADRFARAADTTSVIVDLCCGIGGDAIALADVAPTIAVDRDPLRTEMARRNAGVDGVVADATSGDVSGTLAHIDPARRDDDEATRRSGTRQRVWDPESFSPPISHALARLDEFEGGALKLGPGNPWDTIVRSHDEVELIAHGGHLVQAVLWSGVLAEHPGLRTATNLDRGFTFTGSPEADLPIAGGLGRYLITPDPTLERAGLVADWIARSRSAAAELHPGLGLLTADAPTESSGADDYEVLADLPFREKRLRSWLRDHDAGNVIVKTRGGAGDAEALRRQLRGEGANEYVVFALRLGSSRRAIVTRTGSTVVNSRG